MARDTILGCLFALAVLVFAGAAFGLLNPHVKPEACESCHTKVPTKDDEARGAYFLLKESIDDTCRICHESSCCKVGSLHQTERDHPSNIDTWDTDKFRRPKTLPLQKGYITCNTCHFHRVPDGESYKMIRIVKRTAKRIDWTELCTDCHIGY